MNNSDIITKIVNRFEEQGYSQVPGYNRFGFVSREDTYVVVSRENGQDTKIPFAKLADAIEAVQKDSHVYSDGPSKLREHGITHINSPLWSFLHLLTIEELKA